MVWSRRRFVGGCVTAGLVGCARPRRSSRSAPGLTLRSAGAARGLLVGCAVDLARLRDTPEYAALVAEQAGILVAENAMKMGPMRPSRTEFHFAEADELFAFAERHGQRVRGHNFVWHRQLPGWFAAEVTSANAEAVLVEHIEHVGGRYAGRVHSWDVVNEAVEVKDGLAGGMRDSPWQRLLPGYIDVAFRTARRVDPKAMLVYNDYGIEGADAGSAKKRAAVVGLLRGMKERGVPVDALGVQSHLGGNKLWGMAECAGLREMIATVSGMGMKVLITELDVNDRELPADVAVRDAKVAAVYGDYLHEVLADEAVVAVLTWGITDRYSWLNWEGSRADKLPERCLPFDAAMQPKAAFGAMVGALKKA